MKGIGVAYRTKRKWAPAFAALLLFVSAAFAGCGVIIRTAQEEPAATVTQPQTKPVPTANAEESKVVGDWSGVFGYNSEKGLIKQDDELSLVLRLKNDLSGALTDDEQSYGFTWSYIGTSSAEHDPSVRYMHYLAKLPSAADIPGEVSFEEFGFDVDTADESAIYLNFGEWLYVCKK